MAWAFSLLLPALVALAAVASSTDSEAQSVYRSVGPDGKVTFSDRAPAAAPASVLQEQAAAPASAGASLAALPYALRQTATRFPVTLYTSSECVPCASARSLLHQRGVPFSERTVQSNEDIEALQRLSGSTSLPFATIGKQQLNGFSDLEWKQYLDAAGYPQQSQLPPNYQRPAAAPLVATKRVETKQTPAPEEPPVSATGHPGQVRPAASPSRPAPGNPAGIRF